MRWTTAGRIARGWCGVASGAMVLGAMCLAPLPTKAEGTEDVPAEALQRLTAELSGRQAAASDWPPSKSRGTEQGRSLRDLYRSTAAAVPFLVSRDGSGTAVVIGVDRTTGVASLITARHVVRQPFEGSSGEPYVMLLFYEPQLLGEVFAPERVERCRDTREVSPWCNAFRRSVRFASVKTVDSDRDLALLQVRDLPAGIEPISEASLRTVEPGDDVAVIGHPRGFLWTLTKGIVSGVRYHYPLGQALGTIIQTQAPVSEGSSGGPLLTMDGRLLGVVSWVVRDAQGLNAAIAINEVTAFASGKGSPKPR